MQNVKSRFLKSQVQGFTIIEIAIVMVVVGLILGMTFKGRELVSNARVKSTYASYNKVVTGMYTFYDRYGFFPGDGCEDNETDPLACAEPRDGVVAGDETSSFFTLLIETSILSSADINTSLGGDWQVGGEAGVASWVYLDGVDLRLACELDRIADNGISDTGFMRAGSENPGTEFSGAQVYDAGESDCWDLSGTTGIQLRILP